MARIRYLKPDFFFDEDLTELPYEHRLAFSGLWCYADRKGRLEDSPKKLKAVIFPYGKENMDKILDDLTKKPFIVRYQANGKKYLQIVNFEEHQKPHHTEKESTIPPPEQTLTVKDTLKDGEKKEGMEKGMGMGNGDGKGNTASPVLQTALNKVYKEGLNIYALLNKLKKESKVGARLPEEVILRVCNNYTQNKVKVENQWAWFTKAIIGAWEQWNVEQNIKDSDKFKHSAVSIKDILTLCQK